MIANESVAPASGRIRQCVLVWLTVQNSLHNLLLRYVRSRPVRHMFFPSVAVFFTEILKVLVCAGIFIYGEKTVKSGFKRLAFGIWGNRLETAKMLIPSIIYTLQNNLFYLAATHLDAATFMVTAQLKILTTALFSRIILSRRLTTSQWLALIILFIGVSAVQLPSNHSSAVASNRQQQQQSLNDNKISSAAVNDGIEKVESENNRENRLLGFCAVLAGAILSGFGGIYFEKVLKVDDSAQPPALPSDGLITTSMSRNRHRQPQTYTLWIRNVQLALWSIPTSVITILLTDWTGIQTRGLLYGFDGWVWLMTIWYGVGGVTVSVCIKIADNILKNYATSCAIILASLASVWLFDFAPSPGFLVGVPLVIFSVLLYSSSSSNSFSVVRHKNPLLSTSQILNQKKLVVTDY